MQFCDWEIPDPINTHEGELLLERLHPAFLGPEAVKILGDSIDYCAHLGKIPCKISQRSERVLDLEYLDFAKDTQFFKENYPVQTLFDFHDKNVLKHEMFAQNDAYSPAIRDEEALWLKFKPYLWDQQIRAKNIIEWRIAWNWVEKNYLQICEGSRVLSLDESLKGVDLSKSCGALFTDYENKKEFIDSLQGRSIYTRYWKQIQSPRGSFSLFAARQKDELRSIVKCKTKSTRIFMGASVQHFLASNQLFSDMNNKITNSRLHSHSAIGMSRYYGEWHDMISQFEGHKCFATDVSGWDQNVDWSSRWRTAYIRYQCLLPSCKNERERQELYFAIKSIYEQVQIKFVELPNGHVFAFLGTVSSGEFNTITDNGIKHEAHHAYLWLTRVDGTDSDLNYRRYMEFYKLKILGDDCIVGIHPKLELKFQDLMQTFNELAPTESKFSDFTDVLDLDFCSQTSILVNGYYMPVPNTQKMLGSLACGRKNGKENCLARANGIRQHCYWNKELYYHTSEYARRLVKKYPIFLDSAYAAGYLTDKEVRNLYYRQ